MPHVTIKIAAGYSAAQKTALADQIEEAAQNLLGISTDLLSIDLVEVEQADWIESVYRPEIEPRRGQLLKEPGYDPDGSR